MHATFFTDDRKREALFFLGYLAVAFLVWGGSLRNSFILDDHPFIPQNPTVQSLHYLPTVVTGCAWEAAISTCKNEAVHYRPLQKLVYMLTWQVRSDPAAFHTVNIFLAALVAYCTFLLARAFKLAQVPALGAGLLVLLHPAQGEVVQWIAALPELLLAIFTILAVLYRKRPWAVATFYFLALLAKEPALFIVPGLVLLLEWKSWRRYGPLLLSAGLYLAARLAVLGSSGSLGTYVGSFPSLALRMTALFQLVWLYVITTLYPFPYRFLGGELPPLDTKAAFLGAASLGALLLGVWYARRQRKEVVALGLSWYLITLAPMLLFINAGGFGERYLFVPLIGLALAAMSVPHNYFKVALVAVVVLVGWQTAWARTPEWRDDRTFLEAQLERNPAAYRLRERLAQVLLVRGEIEPAETHYKELLAQNPPPSYRAIAFDGLRRLRATEGKNAEALAMACQAVAAEPNPQAQQEWQKAEQEVSARIQKDPAPVAHEITAWPKASGGSITFLGQSCDRTSCRLRFRENVSQGDIVLPSLFFFRGDNGAIAVPDDAAYTGATREIELISSQPIRGEAVFPLCSSTVYTVAI